MTRQVAAALRAINALERRIVRAEDDADAMLWEQASLVVAQLDAGLSQRELARQWINVRQTHLEQIRNPNAETVFYSQVHVHRTRETVERYFNVSPRPRYRDAYNTIANQTRKVQRTRGAIRTEKDINGIGFRLRCGDAWSLVTEPIEQLQAIVTSPPYWRQRVYQSQDEFGQEPLAEYIQKLIQLFSSLKASLRPDGAMWINLGDSYERDRLQAIPARFMVAMIEDGWQLRSEVIYERLNLTPRPARKRPTRSHEHVLLFTLSDAYYYDEAYMREPAKYAGYEFQRNGPRLADSRLRMDGAITVAETRNLRSVWSGSTGWNGEVQHPALMPQLMAERCVLSISQPGDRVLDPFCGAATTGFVAIRAGRSFIGWDIDREYIDTAQKRLETVAPLLAREESA